MNEESGVLSLNDTMDPKHLEEYMSNKTVRTKHSIAFYAYLLRRLGLSVLYHNFVLSITMFKHQCHTVHAV